MFNYNTYRKVRGATLKMIIPSKITRPHEVSVSDCHSIIESMKANGWNRRPIIAIKSNKRIQAITGSHRITSARRVKLQKVPVLVLSTYTLKQLRRQGLVYKNYKDTGKLLEFFYCHYEDEFTKLGLNKLNKLLKYDHHC